MRTTVIGAAVALACLAAHPARAQGFDPTDAISRQVLLYLPPYTTPEVQKALSIAAGLLAATQAKIDRLNIGRDGASAANVDMRDAARIARMAMGLDP